MNKKLFIGNLDYTVTADDLKQLFAPAGTVTDAVVIKDRYTDKSKGFGFLELSSAEEAKKAVEMFHEKEFKGRKMIVNEARPRRE